MLGGSGTASGSPEESEGPWKGSSFCRLAFGGPSTRWSAMAKSLTGIINRAKNTRSKPHDPLTQGTFCQQSTIGHLHYTVLLPLTIFRRDRTMIYHSALFDTFLTNIGATWPLHQHPNGRPTEKQPFDLHTTRRFAEFIRNSTRSQTGKMAAVDETFSTLVRIVPSNTTDTRITLAENVHVTATRNGIGRMLPENTMWRSARDVTTNTTEHRTLTLTTTEPNRTQFQRQIKNPPQNSKWYGIGRRASGRQANPRRNNGRHARDTGKWYN